MLANEKVILIPVALTDAEELAEAINQTGSINHLSYFENRQKLTAEDEREYLHRILGSASSFLFLVRPTDDQKKLVGTIGLHEYDRYNDTARPGVVIFQNFCCFGYGRASLQLLLQFAFQELKVNLMYLNVFPENTADQLYRSVGFADEGILRARYKLRGVYHDMRSMSLTRSEWEEGKK